MDLTPVARDWFRRLWDAGEPLKPTDPIRVGILRTRGSKPFDENPCVLEWSFPFDPAPLSRRAEDGLLPSRLIDDEESAAQLRALREHYLADNLPEGAFDLQLENSPGARRPVYPGRVNVKSTRAEGSATKKPQKPKTSKPKPRPSRAVGRVEIEPGIVLDPGPGLGCFVAPKRLDDSVPFGDLIADYRRSAAEVCDGRWTLSEVICEAEDTAIAWFVVMHPELSKKQRDDSWIELQTWSGIRVESCDAGDGWLAADGEPYGTMDHGLSAHQLRYYPDHGVVVHVVGQSEATLERVLAGLRVTGRASAKSAAPRPTTRTFESLLAPAESTNLGACPGPATRDLQRLASALKEPDLSFSAELEGGGSLTLWISGNEKGPFWEWSIDDDPPGAGYYLADGIDPLRSDLGGRRVTAVRVTMKRPRGDDAVRAIVAERFVEAMQEIADAPAPVARRKRR